MPGWLDTLLLDGSNIRVNYTDKEKALILENFEEVSLFSGFGSCKDCFWGYCAGTCIEGLVRQKLVFNVYGRQPEENETCTVCNQACEKISTYPCICTDACWLSCLVQFTGGLFLGECGDCITFWRRTNALRYYAETAGIDDANLGSSALYTCCAPCYCLPNRFYRSIPEQNGDAFPTMATIKGSKLEDV